MDFELIDRSVTGDADWLHVKAVPGTGAAARLAVSGEVDSATADLLRDAVADLVAVPSPAPVVLDLAGVTFMDSSGIHCLLDCRAAVQRAGRELFLVGLAAPVHRVLEITGLLPVFDLPLRPATPRAT